MFPNPGKSGGTGASHSVVGETKAQETREGASLGLKSGPELAALRETPPKRGGLCSV